MRTLVILAVFFVAGCVYYFGLRRLHFSGASPMTIDVSISDAASTNVYQMSITNRLACGVIFRELTRARPSFGGSKVAGDLTFHYADGKTDTIYLLPGPYQQYTVMRNGTFVVPTNSFFKVLADGGVDLSKIP